LPKISIRPATTPVQSGLVAGADPGAVVSVEVLIEQQIVSPVGIALEFFASTEYRPPAGFIAQEDAGQAIGDLVRDLE